MIKYIYSHTPREVIGITSTGEIFLCNLFLDPSSVAVFLFIIIHSLF